jgi:hypothetical protein
MAGLGKRRAEQRNAGKRRPWLDKEASTLFILTKLPLILALAFDWLSGETWRAANNCWLLVALSSASTQPVQGQCR